MSAQRRRVRTAVRRLALAAAGGVGAQVALQALTPRAPVDQSTWIRTNYRGSSVSLLAGPALGIASAVTAAAGAPAGMRAAAGFVTATSGAVGVYDDVVGARPDQRGDKGFSGHLSALKQGRVTSGLVKIIGVGAAGVVAAGSVTRSPLDRLVAGGVIAGTANLVNLLDLRPGRALKTAIAVGVSTLGGPYGGTVAGPLGASAALLPGDLGELTMLGDGGANAIGAVLGLRLAAAGGPVRRGAILVVLIALTLASEKVSFTRVIEATPVLRELDALGRLP